MPIGAYSEKLEIDPAGRMDFSFIAGTLSAEIIDISRGNEGRIRLDVDMPEELLAPELVVGLRVIG